MTAATFHSLYLRYSRPLFVYAVKMVDNVAEAEDIVQEAFVKLWLNSVSVEGAKNYLFKTVKNKCVDHLRHLIVVRKSDKELSYLGGHEEGYISSKLIQSEFLAQIYSEAQSLPVKCRKIFTMLFIEGMCYSEISKKLGVSEANIRTQKAIALKLLRIKIFKEQAIQYP